MNEPAFRGTVLVVDDEPDVLATARGILEDAGYQVLAALSAEAAVQASASHAGPVHLLLADVVMPHVSGRVLARQLRLRRPEMKVLFMSGFALLRGHQQFADTESADEGETPVILKPSTGLGLVEKIRTILEQRPQSPFDRRPDPWGLR